MAEFHQNMAQAFTRLVRDDLKGSVLGTFEDAAPYKSWGRMEPRNADFHADFQSAVSRISNPLALRSSNILPTGSRRHSRLETCATSALRNAC